MTRDTHPGEVRIRRLSNRRDCEVVVLRRGQQMVIRLPDYDRAVKWARMECKTYKIPTTFLEEPAATASII